MISVILMILGAFFAAVGLVQTGIMIARAAAKPPLSGKDTLLLLVGEDPDTAESSLRYYYRAIRDNISLEHATIGVALPQNVETRRICNLFCRDLGLDTYDLLPLGESIIMERDKTKERIQTLAAEDGTTERDGGGRRFSQ